MTNQSEVVSEADAMIWSHAGIMGGEPVFRGTRVPVRTIALMRTLGATHEEILSGYPALTKRMVDLAEIWSAAHPAHSQPS